MSTYILLSMGSQKAPCRNEPIFELFDVDYVLITVALCIPCLAVSLVRIHSPLSSVLAYWYNIVILPSSVQ